MEYRIAQSQKYLGNDYWEWSAWIEASPERLGEVTSVVWLLHPTFHPSRVESTSRATLFRLDTSGWGTFRLRAEIRRRTGEPVTVGHMLELDYPDDGSVASASGGPREAPYLYLSYSSEDAAHAGEVREAMNRLGIQVRDVKDVAPGAPLEAAVRKMIRESAGVMSVMGSEYASPYVISEMKLAESEEKPSLALLPDGVDRPPGLSADVPEARFGSSRTIDSALSGFVGSLKLR